MNTRIAGLLAALICLIAAPAASADTLCVNMPAGSACDLEYPSNQLQNALADAANASEADDVRIGPGTYSGSYAYSAPAQTDRIIGSGTGAGGTKIVATFGTAFYLDTTGSSIENIALEAGADHVTALGVNAGTAQDVALLVTPGTVNTTGANLSGQALLRRATITGNIDGFGVRARTSGSPTIEDSLITGAGNGIEAEGPASATVRRVRIEDAYVAIHSVFSGSVTMTDSLVLLDSGRTAVGVDDNGNSSTQASAFSGARLTIAPQPGATNTRGFLVHSNSAGDNMTAVLRDSVIAAEHPFQCIRSGGLGSASLTADFVHYPDPVAGSTSECSPFTSTNRVTGTPSFVDAGAGDFRLRPGSALIDAGDPAALPGGTLDRDGNERPRDGNGDGTSRVDVGAFEYQRRQPSATAAAAPATVLAGQQATFSATGSDADPGDTLTYSWSFDDGGSASGPSVSHAFANPGQHSGTVTVTDSSGRFAIATATVTVNAVPEQGGNGGTQNGGTQHGGTTKDLLPPTLSALAIKPRRLRIGTSGTISFNLGEAGTVKLAFERKLKGRRRGAKCITGKKAPKRGKKCSAYAKPVTMSAAGSVGANTVKFDGRRGRKTLPAGSYRLTVTATDAAGNVSSPARTTFTLLPKKRKR